MKPRKRILILATFLALPLFGVGAAVALNPGEHVACTPTHTIADNGTTLEVVGGDCVTATDQTVTTTLPGGTTTVTVTGPTTTVTTTGATTTVPSTTSTLHEGFAPNGTINGQQVWATASWDSPRVDAPNWYAECHPCYSRAIPDSTDGDGHAMELSASDYNSSGTLQAWLHNPLTVNGSWGSSHRVDIRVKPVKWGSTAQANCSWAGGPKIFMGRPQDVYETSTYTVELNICEGHAYIQKKEWGDNYCGKDPRAVDCGAGGTWYNLKTVNLTPASFGAWHTFSGTDTNNANGSVTLSGSVDGVKVIEYTECAAQPCSDPNGPLPRPPLRGGREGWRSNMIDWLMDSYDVTASP